MRRAVLFSIVCGLAVQLFGFVFPAPLHADSLTLMSILEYEVNDLEIYDKGDKETTSSTTTSFNQRYNLSLQKEIYPTLRLNAGGLFERERDDFETDDPGSSEGVSSVTSLRPYADLQLNTGPFKAAVGYRRNEIKRSPIDQVTTRSFTDEYSARLSWEPVELPEVSLAFSRNDFHNDPKTREQSVESYQLKSRYTYDRFDFSYSHSSNKTSNKMQDFEIHSQADEGRVRFSDSYRDGKLSLSGGLRARYNRTDFSGSGERRIDSSGPWATIGTNDDEFPVISEPEDSFSLNAIDLLIDQGETAVPFSFGVDFSSPTTVDTLLINLADDLNGHRQDEFIWELYVRDEEMTDWQPVVLLTRMTNVVENRFELTFAEQKVRYLKLVTRPIVADGETLKIESLTPQVTLPPDTSSYSSFDWTGDMQLTWRLSDKTTAGGDLMYREQQLSSPLSRTKAQLNGGLRLSHRFNDVYSTNLRLSRTESREDGETLQTSYSFSAALAARYLETFSQNLSYSFSLREDSWGRVSTTNGLFLRSNMELYRGLSLYVDNGYTRLQAETDTVDSLFLRLGSNIVPNRWLNLNLSYGSSWTSRSQGDDSWDQNGRLVVTWVPTTTLSLSADLFMSQKGGNVDRTTAEQRYSVSWSPLRDGTLSFAFSYNQSQKDTGESAWSLSPVLRWQINSKTLLTLDYALGEREDSNTLINYENVGLSLRFYY
ncbi:MAG: hypothetical protein C0622_07565 [Desulfuromonas sp.]|nr:MAG: hypothetical protein C0622_07565 [Desulfuromonas sp.]